MLKNILKKSNNCKACYTELSERQRHMGFCGKCAEKEIVKMKRRIFISPVLGILLVFAVFFIIDYISTAAFPFEVKGTVQFMRIPFLSGYIHMNTYFFNRISNLSGSAKIITGLVCFFLPFASYIHLENSTHRYESEMDLYKLDPIIGQKFGSKNSYRVEGVGFFVISIILSLVSGPFFFIYRIYKVRQLSRYAAEEK